MIGFFNCKKPSTAVYGPLSNFGLLSRGAMTKGFQHCSFGVSVVGVPLLPVPLAAFEGSSALLANGCNQFQSADFTAGTGMPLNAGAATGVGVVVEGALGGVIGGAAEAEVVVGGALDGVAAGVSAMAARL